MNQSMTRTIIFAAIMFLTGSKLCSAPLSISHQGRLLDASDQPVADGQHTIIYRIFDDSLVGSELWTETHQVTTQDGFFETDLGMSGTPFDINVFTGVAQLYLELQVSGGQPMTPRSRIGGSLLSGIAERISGDIETQPGKITLKENDIPVEIKAVDLVGNPGLSISNVGARAQSNIIFEPNDFSTSMQIPLVGSSGDKGIKLISTDTSSSIVVLNDGVTMDGKIENKGTPENMIFNIIAEDQTHITTGQFMGAVTGLAVQLTAQSSSCIEYHSDVQLRNECASTGGIYKLDAVVDLPGFDTIAQKSSIVKNDTVETQWIYNPSPADSNIVKINVDAISSNLIVSNIGSSGEDGVSITAGADFYTLKATHLDYAGSPAYHYAIFGHDSLNELSSGAEFVGGNVGFNSNSRITLDADNTGNAMELWYQLDDNSEFSTQTFSGLAGAGNLELYINPVGDTIAKSYDSLKTSARELFNDWNDGVNNTRWSSTLNAGGYNEDVYHINYVGVVKSDHLTVVNDTLSELKSSFTTPTDSAFASISAFSDGSNAGSKLSVSVEGNTFKWAELSVVTEAKIEIGNEVLPFDGGYLGSYNGVGDSTGDMYIIHSTTTGDTVKAGLSVDAINNSAKFELSYYEPMDGERGFTVITDSGGTNLGITNIGMGVVNGYAVQARDSSIVRSSSSLGDLTMTKSMDKSSTQLDKKMCTGEHIGEIELKWYSREVTPDEVKFQYMSADTLVGDSIGIQGTASAAGTNLKVSNIGSSGEDGVSIDVDPTGYSFIRMGDLTDAAYDVFQMDPAFMTGKLHLFEPSRSSGSGLVEAESNTLSGILRVTNIGSSGLDGVTASSSSTGSSLQLQGGGGGGGSIFMEVDATPLSGKLGVNNLAPVFEVDVIGSICATGGIGCPSDIRYKKNIECISEALETIDKLRGVNFDWKTDEYAEKNFSKERQVGFIAQEIKNVLPSVVVKGTDGYFTVDYARVTPLLVEAIKEQQVKIDSQETTIEKMQSRLNKLERAIMRLTEQQDSENEIEYSSR